MTSALHVTEAEWRALLVEELELIEPATFEAACAAARRFRTPLDRALAERARLPHAFLLEQLASSLGVGFTSLRVTDVSPDALKLVREEFARANGVVAFRRDDGVLDVALADPRQRKVIAEIERLTRLSVRPHLAPMRAIHRAHLLYRGDLRELLRQAGAAPLAASGGDEATAAALLTQALEYAALTGASDIHIEPYDTETIVRFRIDGVLQDTLVADARRHPSLVARIKVLASMRIDERRVPQDGRFQADAGGIPLDLRVSSIPTYWGEKVVMRVLVAEGVPLDLEDLGLVASDYPLVLCNVTRPFGMVLITGPTGSGKTTTLYAMLARIGLERHNVVNIATIEDPVEQPLPRINQISVNTAAGLDFPHGLRALLRQDPDVIMVGEIRDGETAEIAVRAALVGRLLLSTLHTNDATSAVPRLIDMGIEPFLVASTLQMVMAQRLVRRICTACRVTLDRSVLEGLRTTPAIAEALPVLVKSGVLPSDSDPLRGVRLFKGSGCARCHGTGFRGRVGIFEVFVVDDAVRRLIMQRQDASAIRAVACQSGMKTMYQDGLAKVFLGETTLDEIERVSL